MTLIAMMTGLVVAKIRVVVVGGMAVRFHGVNRVTEDVDVCYDTSFRNERALVELLREWHAHPAGLAAGRSFDLTRQELRRHDTLQLQTVHGSLDVMRDVPYLGAYRHLMAHADSVEIAPGIMIPTLNLESLIRSKELGGRKKDEEVVEQLRAVRALRLARETGVEDIAEGIVPAPNVGFAKKPRRKLL